MTARFNQQSWGTAFPVFILDRGELQAYLSSREVDQLTDEDLETIAKLLKAELEELGFYDQLIWIVQAQLQKKEVEL